MYQKCLSHAEPFPRILDKLYLPNWGVGQAGCLACQTQHLQVELQVAVPRELAQDRSLGSELLGLGSPSNAGEIPPSHASDR